MPDPTLRSDIVRYTASSPISTDARPPGRRVQCWSPHMIFSDGSSSREGTSTGRNRASKARSAMRADRLADRVAPNVAVASTRVPTAVDTSAMVAQSAIGRPPAPQLRTSLRLNHHRPMDAKSST